MGVDAKPGSEDPVFEPTVARMHFMMEVVKEFSSQLKVTLQAMEDFNKEQEKLARITSEFFLRDTSNQDHAIWRAMTDYDQTMKAMVYDIPKRMKTLLEDEVVEPVLKWNASIHDTWSQPLKNEILEARRQYDHYVEKIEQLDAEKERREGKGQSITKQQQEHLKRNNEKLKDAKQVYDDLRDKLCEQCDDILLPRKHDFLKLALRVVQFQQTLYKQTAKKGEPLNGVVSTMQNVLEKGEQHWADTDFASHKKEVIAKGADRNDSRVNEDENHRGRSGSHHEEKDLDHFMQYADALEDDLRNIDEDEYEKELDRLEQIMMDAPRSDRREMKSRLRAIEDAWGAYQQNGSQEEPRQDQGHSCGNSASSDNNFDISRVPPEHVQTLRKDPSLAGEFDRIYGPGASSAILQGGSDTQSKKLKPKPEHMDMLMNNPELAPKFDEIYGEGSAKELLRRTGKESKIDKIPPEHVEKLKSNPQLASEFDRIYGPGTADEILGKQDEQGQLMELTYAGYEPEEPTPPTLATEGPLIVNGKEVQPKHIEMLANDPSLSGKFDEFYGPGASQQILSSVQGEAAGCNIEAMDPNYQQENHCQETKAQAVESYQAQRQAASPRHSTGRNAGRKQPSEKHIQMLRDNPSFAPKFDQVYGEGAADACLGEPEDTYRGGDPGPMFPSEKAAKPDSVSPLDLSKISGPGKGPVAGGHADADPEDSGSPRTQKWRKENETREAMGLKAKAHPSKKKK